MKKLPDVITEAYCVELDSVVDIFEAHQEYFYQNEPRQRFNFLCSDDNCRSLAVPPEITGVNYSNEVYENMPHFRRNPHHEHSPHCIWGTYNNLLNEIYANKQNFRHLGDRNLLLDFKKIDSSDVIDAFCSRKIVEKTDTEKKYTETKISNSHMTKQQLQQRIAQTQKKTSLLHRIVEVFTNLTKDEKRLAKLTILDNPRIPYGTAFKRVDWARNCHH